MNGTDPLTANIPTPTSARPLLGLTVLVVEDSRFACEAIRLLCLRSGARIRRADCLHSARRHLQVYRPSVAIIDLGLPDGNGADLIAELSTSQPRVEALLAMSGDTHLEQEALSAGADGFLAKPVTTLSTFQECILAALPPERQPAGPRVIGDEQITPDRIAYQDDISHIADVLEDQPNERALDYVAQFLGGLARSAEDSALEAAASALAQKRAAGMSAASEAAMIAGLIQSRLSQKIAI
ncbi:Response regulator receiver domain-containing protein [Sulfitobacter brevis]|uniref:Response regulator receiver domain-containing protein n=1 Tax=Sulfitobacter brevis TaxID=74348 RepID=A0A1I1TQT2_9RHOB|nr:response regulator [Sulfitobacter brevis]SFD60899.1 Response regulator receiver domain-containing protein [Sulfitobacter brevis]